MYKVLYQANGNGRCYYQQVVELYNGYARRCDAYDIAWLELSVATQPTLVDLLSEMTWMVTRKDDILLCTRGAE